MSRPCTVCTHPKRGQIDQSLAGMRPVIELAKDFEIGESSLRRHLRGHLAGGLLRGIRESGNSPADVVELLLDSLTDISAVRSAALMAGHSALVIRAALATKELAVVLLDRLGMEDTSALKIFQEASALARAVASVSKEHPRVGQVIAKRLREVDQCEQAEALETIASESEVGT